MCLKCVWMWACRPPRDDDRDLDHSQSQPLRQACVSINRRQHNIWSQRGCAAYVVRLCCVWIRWSVMRSKFGFNAMGEPVGQTYRFGWWHCLINEWEIEHYMWFRDSSCNALAPNQTNHVSWNGLGNSVKHQHQHSMGLTRVSTHLREPNSPTSFWLQ